MDVNPSSIVQRESLFTILNEAIEQTQSQATEFALLLLKIDQFRKLNLNHGFDAGDRLIEDVFQLLANIARPQDMVLRYGGSEFLLLLRNLQGGGHADLAAIRVLTEFEDSFRINDQQVMVNAHIGGAIFPFHGRDPATLCSNLEHALLESRKTAEHYYIHANNLSIDRKLQWDINSELKRALEKDQLELHFQPQVDLRSGRVTGTEALLRWKHPVRGYIPPGNFIEIAEQSGLIHEITLWTIHTALWFIKEWPENLDRFRVSVNLSARAFEQDGLAESIHNTTEIFDTRYDQLTLEVTESAIVKDMDSAINILDDLKAMGVNISIDDFGTGYSSFSYFKRIPASELKIDRSFVSSILHDDIDLHIVESIIKLAHGFGLMVVAEGVEDRKTYQMLSNMGCDKAQGFYVSKPLPPKAFISWLYQYNEAIKDVSSAAS